MPLGLIDQSTVAWQPLPDDENNYFETEHITLSYHSFDDSNAVVTGVQLTRTDVVTGKFLWFDVHGNIPCMTMFGRKIKFENGSIGADEVSRTHISAGAKLDSLSIGGTANGTTVQNVDRHIFIKPGLFLAYGSPDFDQTEVSLATPISSVGLMFHKDSSGSAFVRPYVKSFRYDKIIFPS